MKKEAKHSVLFNIFFPFYYRLRWFACLNTIIFLAVDDKFNDKSMSKKEWKKLFNLNKRICKKELRFLDRICNNITINVEVKK